MAERVISWSLLLIQCKSDPKSAAHYWRQLPARIKILYITARQRAGAWLTETLSTENIVQVELEEALGTAAGLARLRDEVFDALLVDHLPGELDALDLVEGYRAGGAEEPIIVLGTQSEQELAALCYRGRGRCLSLRPHHDHAKLDLGPCPGSPTASTAARKSSP